MTPPHLLKLARNHLLDQGFILNPREPKKDHKIASVQPLEELVKLAPGNDVPLHKLTRMHLAVQGTERQVVKYAAQLLSHKTSVAVHDAGEKKFIRSKDCEVINNIFFYYFCKINALQQCASRKHS